jgi:glycosyltransferase involved in cell wall biosynthesis
MAKSYYIITIHNKEDLLAQVLDGINACHDLKEPGEIIAVLDGCTDASEKVVDTAFSALPIKKLYSADTHEIASINTGLTYIRTFCFPQADDLVFMLQDDIILKELQINLKLKTLFEKFENLGYVSMRLGLDLSTNGHTLIESNLIESEYGHWKQLSLTNYTVVNKNELIFKEVVVRSPACMKWDRFDRVGVFDSALSPCGFDCHDMSIRMNQAGYRNAVVGFEFYSKYGTGTMTKTPNTVYNSRMNEIYERNKKYLAKKHEGYFKGNK